VGQRAQDAAGGVGGMMTHATTTCQLVRKLLHISSIRHSAIASDRPL